jgi:hypothetical protein
MLVTLVVISTLLAGGGVLTSLTLRETRSTSNMVNSSRAQHCAEAGIATARATIAANAGLWNASLCSPAEEPCAEPAWLASPAVNHELDAPPVATDPPDFQIILKDNDDEVPGINNPDVDTDQTIYIVATCLKYPDTPTQVSELVHLNAGVLQRRLWLVTASN